MDQFEIIWILVTVIGALNYGLNASGSNHELKRNKTNSLEVY